VTARGGCCRPLEVSSWRARLGGAAVFAKDLQETGVCRWEWAREATKGHLVDALALRGEEGRGTLRKARGRCERSVIPGSPNGATHPARGIVF
jgi:hypothetical protein